jgi:hypothetical protein
VAQRLEPDQVQEAVRRVVETLIRRKVLYNQRSAKIYYPLLQPAHAFAQLLERGSLLRNHFPDGFGSAKNLAFRLLEARRNQPLEVAPTTRFQIRFDFDSS